MVKVASKGTVLQQEISSVLVARAQLDSITYTGSESEVYDCTTLDGAVGRAFSQTGYSSVGEVSLSGFYDPVLASHTEMRDLITTPAQQNWAVVFADTAATTMSFAGAGITWENTVAMSDGLKFSATITVTGLPTYA
jgi:hypothetical protein